MPPMRSSAVGDRSLAVACPLAWNNLPVDLRLSQTFSKYFQSTPEVTSVQFIFPFSLTVSLTIFYTEPLKPFVLHTPAVNLSLLHDITFIYLNFYAPAVQAVRSIACSEGHYVFTFFVVCPSCCLFGFPIGRWP